MNNQQIIENIINKEIFTNQTVIVNSMLATDNSDLIQHDDIENAYHYVRCDTGETMTIYEYDNGLSTDYDQDGYEQVYREILQWFAVSSWLADKLFVLGQPVIRLPNVGYWWGRTCYGQALEDDYVFEVIAKELA